MMRVSVPILPTAYSWRGRITGRRRGVGHLATKAEAEVLAVWRATFISSRSSMLWKLS
jgi:hypothetical protein